MFKHIQVGDFKIKHIANEYSHILLLLVILFFCTSFQIVFSDFGRYMPAIHGDWASHAVATKFINDGLNFQDNNIQKILNEFAIYPRGTYEIASALADLLNLPPIYALTVTIQMALLFGSLFYALRGSYLSQSASYSLVFAFCMMVFMFVFVFRFGWRDLVISNSFITQLLSIIFAQLFILIAFRARLHLVFSLISIVSAFFLVNLHIIGFGWSAVTLLIMATVFPGTSKKTRVNLFFLVVITNATAFFFSPGAFEMAKIAGTGGHLRVFLFLNASEYYLFFIFMLLTYLIVIPFLYWFAAFKSSFSEVLWKNAGFIAIGPLVIASSVTIFIKGGNWYPVVKWLYLMAPEFSLVFLNCRGCFAKEYIVLNKQKFFIVGVLVFFLQFPFLGKNIDLEFGVLADKGVVFGNERGISERFFPDLKVQHPALNYYIARAILRNPFDKITSAWMSGEQGSWRLLGPADFFAIPPQLDKNKIYLFNKDNKNLLCMLGGGWWPPEKRHVWASRSPASITFDSKGDVREIFMTAHPFLRVGEVDREFRVRINSKIVGSFSLRSRDFSTPDGVVIKIASTDNNGGRIFLELLWDNDTEQDLGLAILSFGYR